MSDEISAAADQFRQALGNAVTAMLNSPADHQALQIAATLGEQINRFGTRGKLIQDMVAIDLDNETGAGCVAQRLMMLSGVPGVETTRKVMTLWTDLRDERDREARRDG